MKNIKQLWKYLLNPTPEQESSNFITKFIRFLVVLGINVAAVTIAVGIQYCFKNYDLIDIDILPILYKKKYVEQLVSFLITIFIIPIIEELLFRLHLIPQKQNIRISIIILFLYLITELVFISKSTFAISLICSLGAILLLGYIIFKKRINDGIKEVWKNKFRSVFYVTALVFGGVHIMNHKLSITNLIFAPIIVAPQIIMGLNAGYLRIKSGFKWGLLLHVVHNFVFVTIFVYLMNPHFFNFNRNLLIMDYPSNSNPPKNYSLTIDKGKENAFNTYKITPAEISFENTKVKEVFARLANANHAKVIFENQVIENKIINLKFLKNSQEKSTIRNNRHFIISELFKKYNLKANLYVIPEGYWLLTQKVDQKDSMTKALIPDRDEKNKELVTIQVATVEELVDKIEKLYSVNCVALIHNRNKFNFEIPKNDMIALQKLLLGKYNLEFHKMNTKTDCFYISTRND